MQTVPPDRREPLILSETLKVNWCCKGQVSLEIKCSTKLELGRCMTFTFLAAIWRRLSLFVQLYSLLFENHCLEWKKNKNKKPCDLCLGDSGRQILEFLKSVQFWEMLRNVTLVIAVLFLPFDFFFSFFSFNCQMYLNQNRRCTGGFQTILPAGLFPNLFGIE